VRAVCFFSLFYICMGITMCFLTFNVYWAERKGCVRVQMESWCAAGASFVGDHAVEAGFREAFYMDDRRWHDDLVRISVIRAEPEVLTDAVLTLAPLMRRLLRTTPLERMAIGREEWI
jgi:hypothetical protein